MLRHTLFAIPLAVLAVSAAAADLSDLPAVDQPGQWRIVTPEDATTTSRCVGRATTPLCAVETLLACFQRGRQELCRQVDEAADQYADVFTTTADPNKYVAYRVVAARPEGDGVHIDLVQHEFPRDKPITGATDGPLSTFSLHRRPDGAWTITDWDEPDE